MTILYRGLSEESHRELINLQYMKPKKFSVSQPKRVDFTTSKAKALKYGSYALAIADSEKIGAKPNPGVKNRWSVFGKVPLRKLKELRLKN